MKKLLLSSLFALVVCSLYAQESTKISKGRPNLPGTFLVEVGVNRALNANDTFNTAFWGSRTLNLYYQHEIKIPFFKGKLSFHPGIGFGFERYKFRDYKTLSYNSDGNLELVNPPVGTTKSQLISNYLDAPMELRFSTNPYDPSRSFKLAVGFRPGVLIGSHTKLKYKEDGDVKKFKDKQPWNLNNVRYGIYGRIGVGNFNFFGYYNMSTYFKEGKGVQGNDINTLTIGVSLAGF